MLKKCSCGQEYDDQGFKTMCPRCFVKSKNGNKKSNNKDRDIHKQVFLKVASEQKTGTPIELVNYAKELEREFDKWI